MRCERANRRFIGCLEQAELFSGCTRRELRALTSFCTPIEVRAGGVLTHQGEHGSECFVVIGGHAVVERNGVTAGRALDGSIIGEIALIGDGIRTATVTAATDMTLLVFSRSEVGALRTLGIANSAWRQLDDVIAQRLAALDQLPV